MHQADEQSIGKADYIGALLLTQPANQFVQLTRLIAFFAAKHRNGDVAQVLSARFRAQPSGKLQQRRRIEKTMHPWGRVAEPSPFLFEVNIDSSEERWHSFA